MTPDGLAARVPGQVWSAFLDGPYTRQAQPCKTNPNRSQL